MLGLLPQPDATRAGARAAPSRRERAFTLVELISVIAVLALVAVSVVPAISSMAAQRQRVGAHQVLRDLTYARERAMSLGVGTWVSFSVANQTYAILQDSATTAGRANASSITDPATRAPFLQRLNVADFQGVTIDSATFDGSAEIGFDTRGRPLSVSGAALSAQGVVSIASGAFHVRVTPTSGLVTLTP